MEFVVDLNTFNTPTLRMITLAAIVLNVSTSRSVNTAELAAEFIIGSRYFSEYAFEKMTGKKAFTSSIAECATANEIPTGKYAGSYKEGNKELLIIAGASHVDLYDDEAGVIPYNKLESFFRENL